MLPNWARVLRQHREEGKFGLTLSFLVGAIREPLGAVVAEDVSTREFLVILNSMRDCALDLPVRVVKCVWLQQPVAALDTQVAADEIPILPADGSKPHLFVARRYLADGSPDVDTAFRNLWPIFRQPINEGKFSYSIENDEFQPFDVKDESFIRRALDV